MKKKNLKIMGLCMLMFTAASCSNEDEPSMDYPDFPQTDIPGLLNLSYSDQEKIVNTGLPCNTFCMC